MLFNLLEFHNQINVFRMIFGNTHLLSCVTWNNSWIYWFNKIVSFMVLSSHVVIKPLVYTFFIEVGNAIWFYLVGFKVSNVSSVKIGISSDLGQLVIFEFFNQVLAQWFFVLHRLWGLWSEFARPRIISGDIPRMNII